MEEIRDKAISKLRGILDAGDMMLNPPEDMDGFIDKEAVKQSRIEQILSIPEIAIVDRDAELPENKMKCSMRIIGEPEITKQVQEDIEREMSIYEMAQQDMLKAGYVKEVKDVH